MIKIDDELVDHLSKLARLEVTDREKLKAELQKIINYFEILNEVDTSNFEPMYTPIETHAPLRGLGKRETEAKRFRGVEDIVANFPERKDRLIKVPGIYAQ